MNHLYFWEGKFLYIGDPVASKTHANHSLEIALALESPFQLQRNGTMTQAWCMVIQTDSEHKCIAPSHGRLAHISLDPESDIAKNIISCHVFTDGIACPQSGDFHGKFLRQDLHDRSSMENLLNEFLLGIGSGAVKRKMDSRIKQAVSLLRESEDPGISLKEIARVVELSSGRFVHLFKQETGIPLRRYILWNRLNRAILRIAESASLTDAAHYAGFADSAHFSRTFFRMFGLSPSEILKNSQFVQA